MSQAVMKKDRKRRKAADQSAAEIPPELLLRRDQSIRFQRGGIVYATDGRVGQLHKIVVDDQAGEVAELIIQADDSNRVVVLTADLVDKTAGSAIFITVNRVQFQERTAAAQPYDKKQFAKVDTKELVRRGEAARQRNPRRAVIHAGPDFVETPLVSLLDRLERKTPSRVSS